MNDINQKSVFEWDGLEKSKGAHLSELRSRMMLAEAQRADLILLIGEMPNDKTVKKDLETIEKTRKDLALEIESIEALLKAIPERRNFARAREIEGEITTLEKFDEQLKQLAPEVDAAAENFVLALRKYFDVLDSVCSIDPKQLNTKFFEHGIWDSVGVYLRKFDLWRFVKVGAFRDAKTMTDNLERNPSRKQIAGRIHRMREVAKSLRSEAGQEYCPNCYGKLILSYGGDPLRVNLYTGQAPQRRVCQECGREA